MERDDAVSAICRMCKNPANLHIHLAANRRWVEHYHLCNEHSDEWMKRYFRDKKSVFANRSSVRDATRCDIEMLVARDGKHESLYYLKEVGGVRRFWSTMSFYESGALYWNLMENRDSKPGVYQIFYKSIEALGGILQDAIIDGYTSDEPWFHARVRIRRNSQTQDLSVRPSDAINLAIVADVPIWVAPDAYSTLQQETKDGQN